MTVTVMVCAEPVQLVLYLKVPAWNTLFVANGITGKPKPAPPKLELLKVINPPPLFICVPVPLMVELPCLSLVL